LTFCPFVNDVDVSTLDSQMASRTKRAEHLFLYVARTVDQNSKGTSSFHWSEFDKVCRVILMSSL
jgi:hypothetical protein